MKANSLSRATVLVALVFGIAFAGSIVPATAQTDTTATTTDGASANASVNYEGERLTLYATSNQSISGETSLPGGETVFVRVISQSENTTFTATEYPSTNDDGSFSTAVDLSTVSADGNVPAVVRIATDSGTIAEVPAVVMPASEAPDTATATATATATEATGESTATETTENTGPGFGLALAAAALAAVALLSRRSA